VLLRDDLPGGEHLDLVPDMIARPASVWSFGNIGQASAPLAWPSGDRRREEILVPSAATAADLGTVSIADGALTLLATQGLRVPGLGGEPIGGIVAGDEPLAEQGAADVAAVGEVSAKEQDDISQHLRDRGDIE
jgi:hypothetical protein